ncbi:hypothetical protein ScPMuIL_009037, partial [Solemya velum]
LTDDADWNPWGEEFENEKKIEGPQEMPNILWAVDSSANKRHELGIQSNGTNGEFVVEIWGKAAIGLYLWEHIFTGQLEQKLRGIWSYGSKKLGNIQFRFRTGPGVIPGKVPKETENLLLVLNGREPSKIDFAKLWLDFLPRLTQLKNVAVVLLGNEQCNNNWIKPYMELRGGPIKFVFLIYDSPDIDNVNFFQWPLGVATYRDFPKVDSAHLPMEIHRKYICNFLGTIYKNSSRETLLHVIEKSPHRASCYINPRQEWVAQETDETREDFMRALAQSDLTLNPVGQNPECYRIYEAMSYGSLPVIEDNMTPGNCGISKISNMVPLRLLKEEKAPVIYIKDWKDLAGILSKEMSLSHEEKVQRRKNIVQWYENFKSGMRDRLVNVLQQRFFNIHR